MQKDKLAAFRAAIVGLVLMPLVLIAPVAKIYQMHLLPTEFPFSLQTTRISCLVFALLCWFSIPFINRHTRVKDADKMRSSGFDPEMVLLLLNLGLLLTPVLIVLILSFLGFPLNDVLISSYSIFVVMAIWLFWKRSVFWPITNAVQAPINKNTKSYTITMVVLSILALAFLTLKIIVIAKPPEGYTEPLSWNLPWAIIYGFLVAICITTVTLRIINSRNAFDMTAFTSTILIYWIPFGTAAYLYWRFKIKTRELPQHIKAD